MEEPSFGSSRRPVVRSKAWVYYTVLAVVALVAVVSTVQPSILVPAFLFGSYAIYLYRGGRFVVWFW